MSAITQVNTSEAFLVMKLNGSKDGGKFVIVFAKLAKNITFDKIRFKYLDA
jgi:hypothetical protein